MNDQDVKHTMKGIAEVNGLPLDDDRIERDLATYKSYLSAMESIRRVPLSLESAPLPIVALKRSARG